MIEERFGMKMARLRNKHVQKIIDAYHETKRTSLIVYFVLRGLVIFCMVMEIIRGNLYNAFLCVLSLVLFMIPFVIQKRFRVKLPNMFETIIFLFIFAAEILGEINNFYGIIPYWDTMLHILNGFLAAAVGFALIDILNKNIKTFSLSPLFVAIVAFCFSMTIGVLWEFFEFGMDYFTRTDMQKDRIVQVISSTELDPDKANNAVVINNIERTVIYSTSADDSETEIETVINGGYLDIGIIDTMKDLIVNFIGAIAFSALGLLYIANRDKYKFAENFIITKNEEE